MAKVRLLNDGCYAGLKDVIFPVVVDVADFTDDFAHVPVEEIYRIGGNPKMFALEEDWYPWEIGTECEVVEDAR